MLKKYIKKIHWLKKALLDIRMRTSKSIIRVCGRSRFLSDLYYFIFSNAFTREHHAVLAGKIKHYVETEDLKATYYLLVRSIHRIEKGLLMRPRREIFGKGYIAEAVDAYRLVVANSENYDTNQLKYFTDVFDKYFSVVGNDPLINKQLEKYNESKKSFSTGSMGEPKRVPYRRDLQNGSTVSYQEFYKLCRQRRSVRWFENKSVPRELIDKAILAAVQAPSACNRQPFEYRIIDDPDLIEKVITIPMGTRGYAHNIPAVAVTIGNLDAYFSERDRHLIYIDASLANMSFMYALETLGLSSCPINWPDIEIKEKEMQRVLDLPPHQRPVMLMGIGYPDENGLVARSEKRSLRMIRKYN